MVKKNQDKISIVVKNELFFFTKTIKTGKRTEP